MEKEGRAGGQINIADRPPHKEKMDWIVEYELSQLKKYDVQILINTEADAGRIASYAPYAIVLATGGTPIKPSSIPGSDLEEAVTFKEVLCDEKVLEEIGRASCRESNRDRLRSHRTGNRGISVCQG